MLTGALHARRYVAVFAYIMTWSVLHLITTDVMSKSVSFKVYI